MLHPYPQAYSQGIEAVTELTKIIRGGTIATEKAKAGACIYTAQGLAMKTALGDYVEPAFAAVADANVTEEQETEMTAAVVELANEVELTTGEKAYGASADAKINWRDLLKQILPYLLALL